MNLGVVLFVPSLGFLEAKASHSVRRVRALKGADAFDVGQIRAMVRSLHNRLHRERDDIRSVEALCSFIDTRANEIRLTQPLPVRAAEPEAELSALYERLVSEDEVEHVAVETAPSVETRLSTAFREARVVDRIRPDVAVDCRALRRQIRVPYGFQNGRFNLVMPEAFTQRTETPILNEACRLAVEGHSLFMHRDDQLGDLQLVVVSDFAPQSDPFRPLVTQIFADSNVEMYDVNAIQPLLDKIVAG